MGFRFRRSIKIAKGLRLNVSGGGLSLSVGGRGATVNLSSRGARATVGIPGTGISWSGNLGGPNRSNDTRDAASRARQAERSARVAAREAATLAKELRQLEALETELQGEAELKSLVEWWRQIAMTPPAFDEYEAALEPRRFDEKTLPRRPRLRDVATPDPPTLDLASERTNHLTAIAQRLAHGRFERITILHLAFGGLLGGAIGAGIATLAGVNMLAFGAVGVVAVYLPLMLLGAKLESNARRSALQHEFESSWPELEARLRKDHETRCRDTEAAHAHALERAAHEHREAMGHYERAAAKAREAWTLAEERRIALLSKLVRGDAEQSRVTLSASLEALDFPFETEVEFHIDDEGGGVDLLVDLPEIEDCIPETRQKAQKNGTTKEVRRTKAERFAHYAKLVVGLGLALVTQTFCTLPAARRLRLAAFTQRRARGKAAVEDQFIYELSAARTDAEDLDIRESPLELLRYLDCRVDLDPSGNFRKLTTPPWMSRVREEEEES